MYGVCIADSVFIVLHCIIFQERVTGFEQRIELCLPENIQQQLERLLAQGPAAGDGGRQVRVLQQKSKIENSDALLQYYVSLQVRLLPYYIPSSLST